MTKKLSLINVHDYPGALYSAYWEIGITPDGTAWIAKIMDRAGGSIREQTHGTAVGEDDARHQSQTWVLERIENYRRPV